MDSKIILIVIVAALVAVGAVAVVTLSSGSNDTPPSSDMVRYEGNGGATDDGITHYDTKMTNVQKSLFKKEDYHFKEWNTKANGSGTAYQPGQTVSLGTVLYAQWSDANSVDAVNLYTSVFHLFIGQKGSSDLVNIDDGSADLPASSAILVVSPVDKEAQITVADNLQITIVSGTKTYKVDLGLPASGLSFTGGDVLSSGIAAYLDIGQSGKNAIATVSISVIQHRSAARKNL
ncbi:MAG: hypothetical protein E7Z69_00195 [Thermoplasmata archaeon]|nr:hypothetical protein [Thermoplasmata archaeon]